MYVCGGTQRNSFGCWTPATDDLVEAELKLEAIGPGFTCSMSVRGNAEFGVLAGV